MGLKVKIHVNKHAIKRNQKRGPAAAKEPVFTVKTYKSNDYAHEVQLQGPLTLVYCPDKPLSCGAVAWAETNAQVTLKDARGKVLKRINESE